MLECYTPLTVSRKREEPVDWNRPLVGGPVKIEPHNPTVLEAEIEAVILARQDNPKAAARRILHVPRIAKALKLLDDIDTGKVELWVG